MSTIVCYFQNKEYTNGIITQMKEEVFQLKVEDNVSAFLDLILSDNMMLKFNRSRMV